MLLIGWGQKFHQHHHRMLHPICDFQLWPKPWPRNFNVIFWKSHIRNGMADWHGIKWMWVDRMLDPCCDVQRSPHPWPLPSIFKVMFLKSHILWMGWSIDMERKECESIECSTHDMTFNVHLFHDLDLIFSRSNFESRISGMGWLIDMERKWCELIEC